MNLIDRVVRRTGELTFDEVFDDPRGQSEGARYRWIRSLVGGRAREAGIIDFGCWTGATLYALKSLQPARLVGLDLPGPWLNAARKRVPTAQVMEVSDFLSLPTDLHQEFDLAFLLETLEHVERGTERQVLATIAESLKPGGSLILSTPLAGVAAALDPAWSLVGHRHYSQERIRSLLLSADFDQAEIRFSGNFVDVVDMIHMYVDKHLFHRVHTPSVWRLEAMDTGLQERRSFSSATVWAIATKTGPEDEGR